jgi:hypothetical protein
VRISSGARDLRQFGSQGEQRLAVLALLLAEAALLDPAPLQLHDDVLTELDPGRRRVLAERVATMGQTIVTATPAKLRNELARFGPQAGMAELLERWPAAVGPAIARNAWPARIARDGTVHVHTADSVWAFELGQRAAEISARLDGAKLRFAPGPLPEASPAPVSETVVPTAAEAAQARRIAARIGDEKLRESVQKAVSLGLARGRGGRRL